MTLELISLIPLVGSPEMNPLAVKLLNNRLFITIQFSRFGTRTSAQYKNKVAKKKEIKIQNDKQTKLFCNR